MKYSQLAGYQSIQKMEAEEIILHFDDSVKNIMNNEAIIHIEGVNKPYSRPVAADTTLKQLLENGEGLASEKGLKGIHIGYPIGGIFKKEYLDRVFDFSLLKDKNLHMGDLRIRFISEEECVVDYLAKITHEISIESCGRCIFCREGTRQLAKITSDITNGKSTSQDVSLLSAISSAMADGAQCVFGRGIGTMYLEVIEVFQSEIENHIDQKKCPALVCKKYISYHILGSLCKGCQKCLTVCPNFAINGKPGYIHVIDLFDCNRCGDCAIACEYGAIVKAGSLKPKTPGQPIPVGQWKGK
jgi:NADH-quinone oxidoreductase subunit F